MKTNVFYVNGTVAIICATMLAKIKCSECVNILVIENINTSIYPPIFQKNNSHNKTIIELFSLLFQWDKVTYLESSMTFVTLEFDFIVRFFPWVKGFRVFKNLKKTKMDVNNALNMLRQTDNLFVSDNSYMWRFWYRGQCGLNFIEHGASTYRLSFVSTGYKLFLKKIMFIVTGYNYNIVPQSVFLTDAHKSSASNIESIVNIVSVDISSHINDFFFYFEEKYKEKFKTEYREILDLRNKLQDRKHFIYLPISSPSTEDTERYFYKQIKKIKIKDLFFIIKSHSRNYRNSADFYEKYINNFYFFKNDMNSSLPAEFLLYFFKDSKLFSTYSTTQLYSNWWLNKETCFVDADDEFNDLLINEYRGVLEDCKNFKGNC
jgi:hypothetical protein